MLKSEMKFWMDGYVLDKTVHFYHTRSKLLLDFKNNSFSEGDYAKITK